MKNGLIKVACASPEIKVADCTYNTQSISKVIQQAYQSQVSLLVLPELCLTGYTCSDLFFQRTLQQAALASLEEIAGQTAGKEMLVLVGVSYLLSFQTLQLCCSAL